MYRFVDGIKEYLWSIVLNTTWVSAGLIKDYQISWILDQLKDKELTTELLHIDCSSVQVFALFLYDVCLQVAKVYQLDTELIRYPDDESADYSLARLLTYFYTHLHPILTVGLEVEDSTSTTGLVVQEDKGTLTLFTGPSTSSRIPVRTSASKPQQMSREMLGLTDWLRPEVATQAVTSEVMAAYETMEKSLCESGLTDEAIKGTADYFAYVGFNANIIRAALVSCEADERKRSIEICTLIVTVLSRGTSIAATGKEKMNDTAKAMFATLCSKYRIKRTLTAKRHLGPNDVTLSRVVAAHPEIAYKALLCRDLERPIRVQTMINTGFVDFKAGLRGSYVFSVVPTNQKGIKHSGAAAAALTYMAMETVLLRDKNAPAITLEEALTNCATFARATLNSSRYDDDTKKRWFDKMDVQEETAKAWIRRFSAKFPEGLDLLASLGFPTSVA
ncbi:putative nucleoprotein [Hubei diptera virus 5]|uniref:Nucleoprotein n=1 Tax=Hubei diptera virus 5 TaxID=1922886 RepID=A0A1L3KPH4_9VIRU|nr:putative nucleoprotein [Hubei diptera virus 5]APG79290.1 putative nucleoprotein [Hubei diptera virus 5]